MKILISTCYNYSTASNNLFFRVLANKASYNRIGKLCEDVLGHIIFKLSKIHIECHQNTFFIRGGSLMGFIRDFNKKIWIIPKNLGYLSFGNFLVLKTVISGFSYTASDHNVRE